MSVLVKRKRDESKDIADDWDWYQDEQLWGNRVAFRDDQVDVISLTALIHNKKRDTLFRRAIGKQFWSSTKNNEPMSYSGFVDLDKALDIVQKAVDKTKFKDGFAEKLKDFEASEIWKSIQPQENGCLTVQSAPAKRRKLRESERLKSLREKQSQHLEQVTNTFKKARQAFVDWRNFRDTVTDPTEAPDICICGVDAVGHSIADCVKSYFQ